ncbi:MAG: tRNA-splicing endonuclease [Candidatus Heimdallarchaeota archaeon LC_3]|nr:MAG: tRNA-splicing endonuclease [Candidatus Heimdallarchaeota archaeon LC_3]
MKEELLDYRIPPERPVVVNLIGEKAIVWDPDQGTILYRFGYYGNPTGIKKPKTSKFSRPLELTVFEAAYLLENNFIIVKNETDRQLNFEEYFKWATRFRFFEDIYFVYKNLRDKRHIPKPGLKFGSHFTIYKKGPGIDHAPFLIKIFPRGAQITPLDIVSAGRLANSVKKRYIMAIVINPNDIRYYEFRWTKP